MFEQPHSPQNEVSFLFTFTQVLPPLELQLPLQPGSQGSPTSLTKACISGALLWVLAKEQTSAQCTNSKCVGKEDEWPSKQDLKEDILKGKAQVFQIN